MRRHWWAVLIAAVVALVVWLARPRPAGEHADRRADPNAGNPNPPSAAGANANPGRNFLRRSDPAATMRRAAAAGRVDEERRHHDDVAARIHQADPKQQLDGPYIKARIHDLMPLVRECYDLALRERPTLEGRLVLSFEIAGEPSLGGVVESLEFVSGDGGVVDTTLQDCVRATIETQTFAPPDNGGRVKVTYPFVFRASGDGY